MVLEDSVKEVIVDNNEKILVGGSYVGYNNISSKNISRYCGKWRFRYCSKLL